MSDHVLEQETEYLVLEMPIKDNDFSDLEKALPPDSYKVIIPKYLDGTEVIQFLLDAGKIIIPAAVTYLVATRKRDTIKVTYSDENIRAEIESTLSNRKLKKSQLFSLLEKLIKTISDKANGVSTNGTNN